MDLRFAKAVCHLLKSLPACLIQMRCSTLVKTSRQRHPSDCPSRRNELLQGQFARIRIASITISFGAIHKLLPSINDTLIDSGSPSLQLGERMASLVKLLILVIVDQILRLRHEGQVVITLYFCQEGLGLDYG